MPLKFDPTTVNINKETLNEKLLACVKRADIDNDLALLLAMVAMFLDEEKPDKNGDLAIPLQFMTIVTKNLPKD